MIKYDEIDDMTKNSINTILERNGIVWSCLKRRKTLQNAAGKKEITTVLLPLVKLWKIYEYLRNMKKRWTEKTKGPALSL